MRSKNNEYFVLIEGFVDAYMDSYGISPSTREIATGTGLATATVSRYMSYMREHGMIDYAGARNIITKRKRISSATSILYLSVFHPMLDGNMSLQEATVAFYLKDFGFTKRRIWNHVPKIAPR